MKDNRYEMRMYCIVMYNISTMQKGVQSAHCCLEYANKYKNDEDLIKYIEEDKTMIILDGGTSTDLIELDNFLTENEIKHAAFVEPDLNYAISCVCFLADERVWNKKDYPDMESFSTKFLAENFFMFTKNTLGNLEEEYLDMIGGVKNKILREIIQYKRLAS